MEFPWSSRPLWQQAIIWGLIITIGGGLLSLASGWGFWGEKTRQGGAGYETVVDPEHPNRQWGPNGPNQSEKCDSNKDCNTSGCHAKQY